MAQLTDTDIAYLMKRFAKREKEQIVSEKKQVAHKSGGEMSLACRPYEIMRITNAAHDGVVKRNRDTNLVLAGLRRNGQLGYRPDLTNQRLVKVEEIADTWSAGLKEGSHRYPTRYLQDR